MYIYTRMCYVYIYVLCINFMCRVDFTVMCRRNKCAGQFVLNEVLQDGM
jgi:hypothetical protein